MVSNAMDIPGERSRLVHFDNECVVIPCLSLPARRPSWQTVLKAPLTR
jgi:hypothetical protein